MLACLMTALCQCALPSGLIEDAFGRREDAALLLSDSALPSPHALKPPRRLKCTEYRTKQECFADWGYAGDDDAMILSGRGGPQRGMGAANFSAAPWIFGDADGSGATIAMIGAEDAKIETLTSMELKGSTEDRGRAERPAIGKREFEGMPIG